jgi:hypothetical protein
MEWRTEGSQSSTTLDCDPGGEDSARWRERHGSAPASDRAPRSCESARLRDQSRRECRCAGARSSAGSQTSLGATPSSRRARWMRGVRDHHGRVGGQGIQQFFASGDEGFRYCFVEPAGNDLRLVIFETQTIQQRNQSRVAFIDAAKFLRAKGAGLARRTRQRRADPGFRLLLLLAVQTASAALLAKPRQSIDPVFLVSPAPAPGRVVSTKRTLATSSPLLPLSKRKSALARRASRCAAAPSRAKAIRSARSFQ